VRFGVVVGRAPGGERFLAKVLADDERCTAFLTDGLAEPVGSLGTAVRDSNGDMVWQH